MSNGEVTQASRATEEPEAYDTSQSEEMELDDALFRMGQIIEELQTVEDEDLRDKIFELLDWIDGFHREGVIRLVSQLPLETVESMREDPVIGRLFDTYLEEEAAEDVEELASTLEDALDEIRPYLHSHGGEMEVLEVSDGVVRMRLMGSCHGCPSSTVTLTQGVEKILKERWPGFRKIEVEGVEEEEPEPQKLLSIQSLRRE